MIKTVALEEAIEGEDYELAKKILAHPTDPLDPTAAQYMSFDEGHWENYEMEIAKSEGDTAKMVQLAEKNLISSFQEFGYRYEIINSNTPPSKWKKKLEQILLRVKNSDMHLFDTYRYLLNIYMWEEMWDDAWRMVDELNIGLWNLSQIDERLMEGGKERLF